LGVGVVFLVGIFATVKVIGALGGSCGVLVFVVGTVSQVEEDAAEVPFCLYNSTAVGANGRFVVPCVAAILL
jgi:hypothetical protein